MSLLVASPVILPPRAEVLDSWNHDAHAVVLNGAGNEWTKALFTPGGPISRWSHWGVFGDGGSGNLGVAASWNLLFEHARDSNFSHVALISQGVVLEGGTARLAELVDEYADLRGLLTDFAWRVIVLSVAVWEQLGPFDTRFFPAYYEDSDYVRRMFLAGVHSPDHRMPKVERDLLDGTETNAATLSSGVIDRACYGENADRFRAKWGGDPFKETYDRPDDPASVNPTNNWTHYER